MIGRILIGIIFLLAGAWAFPAEAREGRIHMSDNSVSCEGISVWKNRQYAINGRCQGLVYPYAEQITSYVLWARLDDGSKVVRVDDIAGGIIDDEVSKSFHSLFITAERTGNPSEPTGPMIVEGEIAPFDFGPSSTKVAAPTVAPSATPMPSVAVVQTGRSFNASRLASAAPTLIVIGVIVVIIIFVSVLFRRA